MRTERAQRAQDDDGFTLIELLVAMTVFAVLAAAFALTIGGSLRTYGRARARTLAEQLATERLESARSMEYDDIGNPSSDTPGTIPLEATYTRGGIEFTVRTDVDYVDDAIPTGIRTAANYKRVLVDVTQAGASSPLVSLETLVTPTHMPAADRAAVIVEVFDYASPTPRVEDALVHLTGGPSAPRDDFTDSSGEAIFAQLLPNPSPATQYGVTVEKPGYLVYEPDLVHASQSLDAGDIFDIDVRVYRPLTLEAVVVDPAGVPVPAPSSITVSTVWNGQPVTETIPVQDGMASITSLAGKPLLPVAYDLFATTAEGQSTPVTKQPPAAGADPVLTYALEVPYPRVPLDVTVRDEEGDPVAHSTVEVTGGPEAIAETLTTDAAGTVHLEVAASPAPTYTITVPPQPLYEEATATVAVPAPGGAEVEVEVPYVRAPLEITVRDLVTQSVLPGFSLEVTGHPAGPFTGTTGVDGTVTLDVPLGAQVVTIPEQSGYLLATVPLVVAGPTELTVDLLVIPPVLP